MTALSSRYNRQISLEEQKIYDHLLQWIDVESPEQMIQRFRTLFIDGTGYDDQAVVASLDQVVLSKLASEEFRYVLNRCCHILINRWQSRSQSQLAIPKLIELFEATPATTVNIHRSRSLRRLRELTRQFTETEQYLTLRRLAQVLSQQAEANAIASNRPLGTLIRRYPYLYEHCLLSDDSTREQQSTVRQIQSEMQRKFEVDLSQYITYQVRRDQLAIATKAFPNAPQRIIHPVPNPTLLNETEIRQAIHHYVGKVDGSRTYKDLALNFLSQSGHSQSYRSFKDDLYDYIVASVDPEYGKRQFNGQLHSYLKNTLPESNTQRLDDFLIVRTCSQLLNFLVVESPQHPQHYVFLDLVTNLGPVLTTGLLLKIVLLCRKVKPALERRFSILFSHYETYTRDAVQWLVMALENLNVALSAHFGCLDLSFIYSS